MSGEVIQQEEEKGVEETCFQAGSDSATQV